MDLKGTTSLDPKLKEAYEKVMGTSFTPAAPPAPQTPTPAASNLNPLPSQPAVSVPKTEAPLQPPPVQPLHVTEEEQPQPAQPLPPTQPPAPSTPTADPEMVPSPQIFSEVNPFKETVTPPGEVLAQNGAVAEKKSNKFVTIGVVIGGIVFFVIYAFIWAKVFGLF